MEKSWPLTLSQQRCLYLQKVSPMSSAYVDTIAFKTKKDISSEDIVNCLLTTHPILSTKIWKDEHSSEYRQRCVGYRVERKIPREQVPVLIPLQSYISETIPVFNLTNSSLASFRVIEYKNDVVFVAHVHQILICLLKMDGLQASLENILYGQLPYSVSNVTLAQHVSQDQLYLESAQYDVDKEFWMKTYRTAPSDALISLSPCHVEQNFSDLHKAKILLKQFQTSKIASFSNYFHKLGVSNLHFFLSCLTIVLQRYLGTEDVTIAVRREGTYTLFPFRVDVLQNFNDHVAAVSKSWKEIQLHSNFPFLHLADLLWTFYGKSIESLCVLELDFKEEMSNHALVCMPKHARVPLRLQINANLVTDETSMMLEWADGYVDDGIAERFFDSFQRLCLLKTGGRIRDIDYMSKEEIELLNVFGKLRSVEIEEKPIHSTFEEYATKEGNKVAVVAREKFFTYKEINEISNDVAGMIIADADLSKIRERPVVLFMEKDQHAVTAILAVWKVGGYFLPLSTTHETTLKELLRSHPISLMIHNVDISEDIVDLLCTTDIKAIDMRKPFSHRNERCKIRRALNDPIFSDVAYAIRTSGSTGRPKLCKITHIGLNVLSKSWVNACNLCHGARILQWAPLSFDVSIGDLVRALVSVQGTLVICPDDRKLDIPYIHSMIRRHEITNVEFTPHFALRVVENDNSKMLDSLKCLVVGSDIAHQNLFQNIKNKQRHDQILANSYGMTEATIDSTYFEFKEIPRTRSGTVPIGKPLPGVGALILDSVTGLRCPVGTIGELYLYGDTIASGDVICDEVKIDDQTTIKALRTKDQSCWLPSGDIEFYGRLDDVVKIRGFRVSLTEIENKILSCVQTAKDVSVLVIKDQTVNHGKDFLVAYVVPEQYNAVVDRGIICKALEEDLPYYMIPDLVCQIESIPMTLNGKVNKKGLPSLKEVLQRTKRNSATTSENDDKCTQIQMLFAKALGLDDYTNISRTDTFMNQGGHSLVLLCFHGLIVQNTPYKTTIRDILHHPTIDMLEDYLQRMT